jgi:hypothetical protein
MVVVVMMMAGAAVITLRWLWLKAMANSMLAAAMLKVQDCCGDTVSTLVIDTVSIKVLRICRFFGS